MTPDEIVKLFRETKSLLAGHFELRSGLHSDQYFQCALVLQHPRIAEQLCRALAESLSVEADAVISPALGGIVVGHEVSRALGLHSIFAEKQDGKLVLRRGFEIRPRQRFIVAEDVMTRGGRVQETIDIVRSRGGTVSSIAVLVDRSGGKAEFDVPVVSLLQLEPVTWEATECPLCKQGLPVQHPGS